MILNRHFREFIELLEKQRVLYREGTLAMPFIALDDLIANKAAPLRGKDEIDLEELRKIRNEKSAVTQPSLRTPASGTPAASASAEATADRDAPVAPPSGAGGR